MANKTKEIVVITGATAGVGRATVRHFAERGADVALLARGEAGLQAAAREVEQLGGRALPIAVDVADWEAVDTAAERIERELGPIDVWVNDAMTTVFGQFVDIGPEEFKRVTEVDYLGFVNGTRAALKRMLPRDRGSIVQVGSALAYRAIPLQSAYCGAKFAIRGFTDSLRTELLHNKSKVRISMVHLPGLNTPQFEWCENKMEHKSQPVPPIYQPEVAARAIYYAAHHRRREIYVGGSTATAIIGNKLLPRVGDWYLAKTGFKNQQYDGAPQPPNGNLWQPRDAERDFGAHGRFEKKAHSRSLELWLSLHKSTVALALGGAALAGAVLIARTR